MRAFTLIEMMIVIAVTTIMLAALVPSLVNVRRLARHDDFGRAARNAQKQLEWLESARFEDLPPQILRADAEGWVTLGQADVDPASLRVRDLHGSAHLLTVRESRPERRQIRLDVLWAHQDLWVDYSCFAVDRDEAHSVEDGPEGPRVVLANPPVRRVESVLLARGDGPLQRLRQFRLGPDGATLLLGPEARSGVAVVDYCGGRVKNRLSGSFLNEDLRRADVPTPIKQIEIYEDYGGTERMTVGRLKVRQP